MTSPRLLVGTRNKGKIVELGEMLSGTGVVVAGLDEFPNVGEVEEIGANFAENARIKAIEYALATRLPTLADDSGLEVAALGGRPGVLSARYGGDDLPFPGKIKTLLSELADTGSTDRSARFVCAIALADTSGCVIAETQGVCTGRLASEPRGNGGFGYDPIFIPDGYKETFGELSDAIKAQISHRAGAFSQIMPFLARFFGLLT